MRSRLQQFSVSFVIGSAFMHIFCCGIPLLLNVLALVSSLGITGIEFSHSGWFEMTEQSLIIASGALLAISLLVQFISDRINCIEDGACHHEPCETKKDFSRIILIGAVALYAINLAFYLLAH